MLRIICVALLVLGLALPVYAMAEKRNAAIIEVQGTVDIKTPSQDWSPAKAGMVLNEGDIIRTQKDSVAVVNMDGNGETATVEVKQNSQVKLAELIADKSAGTESTLLDLALGDVMIKARKLDSEKSKFEVKTPTSVVGVRGTTFSVSVEAIEE